MKRAPLTVVVLFLAAVVVGAIVVDLAIIASRPLLPTIAWMFP